MAFITMNAVWLYSLISVFIVSLISFVGVLGFAVKVDKLKKMLLFIISFSAGALFGDAFIHLMPEIVREQGFSLNVSIYLLAGILVFFILEKIIHWQQFHSCENEEDHSHSHGIEELKVNKNKKCVKPFAYVNLVGSSLHNLIDGMIIAASYLVNFQIGLATTIAVILHEIPHEFGDFSILLHGGFSRVKALFVNFLSGLISFVGVILTLSLSSYGGGIKMIILPLATGGFIYVAGSDLIPELHKETGLKASIIQILTFIFGIAVMIALLAFS